jgi:hypothetical protein
MRADTLILSGGCGNMWTLHPVVSSIIIQKQEIIPYVQYIKGNA